MKTPFQIHLGPWPCVAVGPNAIFGSAHVTQAFTTAQIKTAAGELYYGDSERFVRYTKADGTLGEEAGYDYNFKSRIETSGGGEMCFTHRYLPPEVVVRYFLKPEIGQVINVDGLVSGPSTARILGFGNGWIQTDWSPQYGDSGSLCWGPDGSFAGAVTSGVRGESGGFVGSIISTPPQVSDPILAGTTAWDPTKGTDVHPSPAPASPAPIAEPPAPKPVSTPAPAAPLPAIPPLSSGAIAMPATPALPASFLVAGSSVFAVRSDGALFRLSSLANLWEQMPELPSK